MSTARMVRTRKDKDQDSVISRCVVKDRIQDGIGLNIKSEPNLHRTTQVLRYAPGNGNYIGPTVLIAI